MSIKNSYNPTEFENEIYKEWEDHKLFHAEVDKTKKPFCIIMPPPNVTSKAHIGHAMDDTLQDILIRYKRMAGYSSLWLPGADHAAIATEIKIVEKLAKEGKTKEMLGREAFDKEAWNWYNFYGDKIMSQFKKMGFSADWDRYRFTMDQSSTRAVLQAFVNLYNKGYIYKGSRLTNWCTKCKSVISDDELDYFDEKSHMWHIRYPFVDGSGYIVVATTRPETLFGDTAVAVNPDDKRYKKIVGKMLCLPLTEKQIPIIADSYVDQSFGTGMVKITPAHDPNDYEVGKRHNLEFISVINKDGTLNECAGEFAGLDALDARDKVVCKLKELKLLDKIEEHTHSVGHCDRCKHAIEPLITEQWFVKMSELVKPAIEVVKNGGLKIYAKKFEKSYFHWLNNIRDWCISRQLWTGHRIPIYYCKKCGETFTSVDKPSSCPKCKSTDFVQDPDVLDTWFSSALWPFSTLGWPDKTPELEYFYPTTVLVTGFDILTQWVTKMVYMGFECCGQTPFKNTLIHGLVRDEQGRKMSKSLGNGVDPLAIIDKDGADALRIALIKDLAMGMDTRFSMQKVDNAKAFINKIWNASKFVSMHSENIDILDIKDVKLDDISKWILSRLNDTIKTVSTNLDKFDIGLALANAYNFAWDEFCDWYIELVKPAIFLGGESKQNAVSVLNYVFDKILKLLHPFIPFVTEYIYKNMETLPNKDDYIMVAKFPKFNKAYSFKESSKNICNLMDTIRAIRNIRTNLNMPANKKAKLFIVKNENSQEYEKYISKLALCDSEIVSVKPESFVVPCITAIGEFYVEQQVENDSRVKEKLLEDIKKIEFEIDRSTKMLSNKGFTDKAPKQLIDKEKAKIIENEKLLATLKSKLN
ncbi:MAG: valine--tRNA ligase [Clostridia bacterium]